jgi:hypothetical protein
MLLFVGCTLTKDEVLQLQPDSIVSLTIDYNITGDTEKDNYTIIILKDTSDLYNQTPVIYGKTNQLSFSKEFFQGGFWILLKRWISNDFVYESKPIFISFQIPENSANVNLKINESIAVKKRKTAIELINLSFDVKDRYDYNVYKYISWDDNKTDDAVSGIQPDIYFKLVNLFSTGYTDFVSQPLGRFTYKFSKTIIPASFQKITLECYDYDFNVSSDDLLFSTYFSINPLENETVLSENAISKSISLNEHYWYDDDFPYSILTIKIH